MNLNIRNNTGVVMGGIELSHKRIGKFITIDDKAKATEVGPLDAAADMFRANFNIPQKKELLELAYDEFEDTITVETKYLFGDDMIVSPSITRMAAALKVLADITGYPQLFFITETNKRRTVDGISGCVVFEVELGYENKLEVVAKHGREALHKELTKYFMFYNNKYVCI